MRRLTKSVGVFVAGLLLGGTAVARAVDSTDLNPVTLCISRAGVREALNESCTGKETQLQVASYADVAAIASDLDANEALDSSQASDLEALGGRLDQSESREASQASALATLDHRLDVNDIEVGRFRDLLRREFPGELTVAIVRYPGPGRTTYTIEVTGRRLLPPPGSPVRLIMRNRHGIVVDDWQEIGTVATDGTFTSTFERAGIGCFSLQAEARDSVGLWVYSEIVIVSAPEFENCG